MEPQRHYDVIIVGAGMAGLAAADTLQQQGKSYVILEGRDRCGGRTLTQHAEKGWLDMGAEFVGATQNYMQQYIQRFNLLTLETYLPTDKNWLYEDAAGTILQFPGNDPLALPGGEEADALLGVFDQLTLNVRAELEQPWRSLGASQLDAITAEQFVLEYSEQQRKRTGKGLSPRTMQIFTVSVRSAFSVEPSQLSMLFLLYYAATAGTYSSLIDVTGGSGAAEATRFVYGTKALVDALVDAVGSDNIRRAHLVQRIIQDDAGVTVETDKGRFRGDHVIVAMSPIVSGKITYEPPLASLPGGAERVALSQPESMPMGQTIKGFVSYKSWWWRDAGLMGYMLSTRDQEVAPLDWVMDNSWDPTTWDWELPRPKNPYALMTFITGDAARYWAARPFEERREAVIAHLEHVFGPRARAELIDDDFYVDMDFAQQPLSMGCPTGVMPPGVLTKYGAALRRPIGRIHWAGSESATEWCGYMNGAMQSGVRAVSEIYGG
ncbi:MAG: FAD-dependent oxidoreductase [Nannocystaceae bacterium]|nr:FAD-dependent oxidoreductase [Myxococcales bacterium]